MQRNIVWLFSGVFITLALVFYFSQRPLWLDENFVYQIISTSPYAGLFGVLENSQAFPRIHLAFIKWFAGFFGFHVLSLRFFSMVFMITALFVWIKLYRRHISDQWVVLLALLGFISAVRMNYYAVEFKPYSMDVLCVGLFALFFDYQYQFEDKASCVRLYVLSVLMPLLIFFSYASLFVFWIVAFNFLLMVRSNKRLWPVLALNVFISLVVFAIDYRIDLRHSAYNQGLLGYWDNYFLEGNSFYAFISSLWEGIRKLSTWWFGNTRAFMRVATTWIPFFLYGLVWLAMRGWAKGGFRVWGLNSLFAVLFLELGALSLMGRYPFTGERITLFLAPFVFYLIAQGIFDLKKLKPFKWAHYGFLAFYIAFCVACLVNTIGHHLSYYQ